MSAVVFPDYRIFTDAASDLGFSMMEGLPPVTVIPMGVNIGDEVHTFGSNGDLSVCDDVIAERLTDIMRLTPSSIIAKLNLRRPLYEGIAAYGHFGENAVDMPWEGTELAEQLTFN